MFAVTNHAVQVMLKEALFHKQNTASSVCVSKEATLRRTFCNAVASSNEVSEKNFLQYNSLASHYFEKIYIQIRKKIISREKSIRSGGLEKKQGNYYLALESTFDPITLSLKEGKKNI